MTQNLFYMDHAEHRSMSSYNQMKREHYEQDIQFPSEDVDSDSKRYHLFKTLILVHQVLYLFFLPFCIVIVFNTLRLELLSKFCDHT